MKLESTVNGKTYVITLNNVMHSLEAPFNLISISRAVETGMEALFGSKGVRVQAPNKNVIMEGTMLNWLYEKNVKTLIKPDLACLVKTGKT